MKLTPEAVCTWALTGLSILMDRVLGEVLKVCYHPVHLCTVIEFRLEPRILLLNPGVHEHEQGSDTLVSRDLSGPKWN